MFGTIIVICFNIFTPAGAQYCFMAPFPTKAAAPALTFQLYCTNFWGHK